MLCAFFALTIIIFIFGYGLSGACDAACTFTVVAMYFLPFLAALAFYSLANRYHSKEKFQIAAIFFGLGVAVMASVLLVFLY
jgi:hypothetical protein